MARRADPAGTGDAGTGSAAGEAGPAAAPDRRRRRVIPLLAGAGVIVLAVVALVWALVGGRGDSDAERAARRFVQALIDGDCAGVMEELSAATDERFDELSRQFTTAADPDGVDLRERACPRIQEEAPKGGQVTATRTLLEGDRAALVHVTSSSPPGRRSLLRAVDVYLVRDGDDWKVDLTLNVIASNFLLSRVLVGA